jgi:PKD repeat protein
MKRAFLCLIIVLGLVLPARLAALTRRVPQEVPTILQALTESGMGDSVLVAPGLYWESGLVLSGNVVLASQEEAGSVVLAGDGQQRLLSITQAYAAATVRGLHFRHGRAARGGAVQVVSGTLLIEDCVFTHNQADEAGGALAVAAGANPLVRTCTFAHNRAPLGSALAAAPDCQIQVEACLFTRNEDAPPLELSSPARLPLVRHSLLEGNPAGDWTGFVAIYEGILGNLSEPPRLCDSAGGDGRLAADSPCLPGNHPEGRRVGALGQGCALGEPAARFRTDAAGGAAPLAVQFMDESLGDPEAWAWDFEDDGIWDSQEQHPAHVYLRAGDWRPRLRVTRGGLSHETVAAQPLRVRFGVSLAAALLAGFAPHAVQFEAQALGQPTLYTWQFGDGDSLVTTAPQAEHLYLTQGQYQPTVRAEDGHNQAVAGLDSPITVWADTLRLTLAQPWLSAVWHLVGPGTVVLFQPGLYQGGTYYASGQVLPDGVQLIGLRNAVGARPAVTLSSPTSYLFNHPAGSREILLRDLVFQGHNGGNGPELRNCSLRVERCEFRGPTESRLGLRTLGSPRVELVDCDFIRCWQSLDADGEVLVRNCRFSLSLGDALLLTEGSSANVEDCRFTDCNRGVWSRGPNLILRRCRWQGGGQAILAEVDSLVLESLHITSAQPLSQAVLDLDALHPVHLQDVVVAGCAQSTAALRFRSPWSMRECVVAGNTFMPAVLAAHPPAEVACTIIHGNGLGDWTGQLLPWQGQAGNLALDPLICSLSHDTLRVAAPSPCLPAANPCQATIGDMALGCLSTDLQAAFSATPRDGLTPLTVQFTDQSPGEVGGRLWDFNGDGVWDSSAPNPIHVYTEEGSWTVTLTVFNWDFRDTLTRVDYIQSRLPRLRRVPEDHATLAQALAAVLPGDTVDVACGIWPVAGLELPDGILLRGRTGDPACVVLDAQGAGRCLRGSALRRGVRLEGLTLTGGSALGAGTDGLGGAFFFDQQSNAVFTRCVLRGNQAHYGGAGAGSVDSLLLFRHCVFHANSADIGAAALFFTGAPPRLEHCLVTEQAGPYLLTPAPQITCSSLFGNEPGNWISGWADQLGQNGNLEADPLYCDAAGGDLRLLAASPCLPPASACGAMGAWSDPCDRSHLPALQAGDFRLEEAWPNPFNPATVLAFVLTRPQTVRLSVFDLAGREVAAPARGPHAAGRHVVRFDGSRCASGLYLAVLEAEEGQAACKLLLVK